MSMPKMSAPAISAQAILAAQERWTRDWHHEMRRDEADPWLVLVQENHWHNFSLWHEEDKARRTDAGPVLVCDAKRAIDNHNQLRNNAMEKMDVFVMSILPPHEDAPLNSETPGMMIDRLSIMALKSYHMAEEVAREDATSEHRERCSQKLATIRLQRSDLGMVLARFLEEIAEGERRFKVYFQFKMYNDPSLNPELYRRKAQPSEQ